MTDWHASDARLRAWVAGEIGSIEAASIEQHLSGCGRCQAVVADVDDVGGRDEVWLAIRDRIEPQPLNLVGRILARFGMTPGNALLVSSVPSLSGAWLLGVGFSLVFAVVAANVAGPRGVAVFLLLAPLAPLIGVAFAFGAEIDPLYELTLSTPYSKFRLLLWRSCLVITTTIPLAMLAAIPLDSPWWVAAAWLLPATAFCAVTLAATKWVEPQITALAISVAWILAHAVAAWRGDPLAAFSAAAMIAYAVVGIAAATVFLGRGPAETFHGRLL
ncbi:MAG TPA: zf-HC2 domain-containing protein [Jiangellaceae bacterium]